MNDFFKHENQGAPPSLSDMGELRQCTKSDLLACLDRLVEEVPNELPDVDAKILDGSVIVNMLPPRGCSTFGEYSEKVFLPYLMNSLRSTKRLDVVWDRYIEGSLKSSARKKRGSGNRVIVRGSTPTPKNRQSFLRVDQIKSELYYYLSECIRGQSIEARYELHSTQDTNIVSSHGDVNEPSLAPCNHEEADTRLILHALHCGKNGHRRVCIRTVDTDVVVLAVSKYHDLPLDELWVSFGVKRNHRIIPVHLLANKIGEEKCKALLFFHVFTGCDMLCVSGFSKQSRTPCREVGKKTAWDTWESLPVITETFKSLSSMPDSVSNDNIAQLQRFVVLLYDRTSEYIEVNHARKVMFARGRQLDRIPPTKAALTEHIKRAVYQAGFCWEQALVFIQQLQSPHYWGWMKDSSGHWIPFWTVLSEAAKACKELIKCGCRKACRPPCKCTATSLPCTELCLCAGTCYQQE